MIKNHFNYFIAPFLFLLTTTVSAQSPADIIENMIEEYSNSLSGIETVMMVSTAEGFMESETPDTTWFRKVMLGDYANLQPVSSDSDNPAADYSTFINNLETIGENARYEGTETIDGRTAHILLIEDISFLYDDMVSDFDQQEDLRNGRLYIDEDDYAMLGIDFEVVFENGNSGSIGIRMLDIREVDGMQIPYVTEMNISGISGSMSEEEMAEARQSMQQFQQQMENVPEAQREMMEQMLAPQIERLESMLEEDGMTMITRMVSVETNVSIPD